LLGMLLGSYRIVKSFVQEAWSGNRRRGGGRELPDGSSADRKQFGL